MTLHPQSRGNEIPEGVIDFPDKMSQDVIDAILDADVLEELGIMSGDSIVSQLTPEGANKILGSMAVA
ncbi:hypothetical protein LAT59_05115 [Candidatus Gracilibacteria bacterium]|nr:hypothetical protein [Candidatus Gracilibacteria bacterium]